MRKGLFAAVLLAWPMASFGVDLALLGGPVDFNWETDTSITFDLYLLAERPINAIQWLVLFEEQAQNDLWTVSDVDDTVNNSGLNHQHPAYNIGVGLTLNEMSLCLPEQWFRLDSCIPAGTYFLAKVTIAPMASMEPYQGQSFTMKIPVHYDVAWVVIEESICDPIGTATPLVVRIVPEPCGICLLLAVAPFMCRRKG